MQIIDVGQITAYVKDLFDSDPLLTDLWLRGEVTSFFESGAGHCYFTLSGDGCQIKAVLFKGNRWSVSEIPKQGDEIIAHGGISVYPDQGQYQLYVDYLAPKGTGLHQLQFERLYRRLEAEGLFDLTRKRPLPSLPETIGVVTSGQGAVLHDITTILRRRYPLAQLLISPSPVQGPDAPRLLVEALTRLVDSGECDVIIVARGGGSPEELAVFNDESLARAIFRSPVPIVSAIGHETDNSIADLVADLRAPTPSAAAEEVVPDRREIHRAVLARMLEGSEFFNDHLERANARLTRRSSRLALHSPVRKIDLANRSVDMLRLRASSAIRRDLDRRSGTVEQINKHIRALSPIAILERGYAAIEDPNGVRRLNSATAIMEFNGPIRIRMQDGDVSAVPTEKSS